MPFRPPFVRGCRRETTASSSESELSSSSVLLARSGCFIQNVQPSSNNGAPVHRARRHFSIVPGRRMDLHVSRFNSLKRNPRINRPLFVFKPGRHKSRAPNQPAAESSGEQQQQSTPRPILTRRPS